MMTEQQMHHARIRWALVKLPNASRLTLEMLADMNRAQRRRWLSWKRRQLRALARAEAVAAAVAA